MSALPCDIDCIAADFSINGTFKEYTDLNDGHINSTYVISFDDKGETVKYTLQKINTGIFKNPDALMSNIVGVTTHIRSALLKAGKDADRGTLTFLKAADGKYYFRDENGDCWRVYKYIDKVYTCNIIDSAEVFENAGRAFGEFQRQLSDYPIDSLFETIPKFHDTYSRFLDFMSAVKEDRAGRAEGVRELIDFAVARESDTHVLLDLIERGSLPLRVTHNDTKLNNILFDRDSNDGICIIDLDTVMPGLSLYDFGDSIRFGANTAAEDEKDISKVQLSLENFKAFTLGYLSTAGESLTKKEIEYLSFSAKLMTLECGMRFLGDFINGDVYFKTDYPEHNLVRSRTQSKLVEEIEKHYDEMQQIVADCCARLGLSK